MEQGTGTTDANMDEWLEVSFDPISLFSKFGAEDQFICNIDVFCLAGYRVCKRESQEK